MKVFQAMNQDISVQVGEKFSIELESLGAAGYEWTARIEDDKLEQVDRSSTPSQAIGGSGVERITFQPRQAGDTAIHLELKRAWESTPAKTHVVRAHIASTA